MLSNLPSALVALLFFSFFTPVSSHPGSVCLSYGIDFQGGNTYFINSLSDDPFSCVSSFTGCNSVNSDVLLVDPDGEEYICSQVPTTPDDTDELSICPIKKNELTSGAWKILLFGDNGDGNPFAYERDITLEVAPQQTTTYIPTVTYNITITPTSTRTVLSTITEQTEHGPTVTIVLASQTIKYIKTLTPPAITSTKTLTFTRHRVTWAKQSSVITKTKTATCSTPTKPSRPDPTCTYTPTKIRPAALYTAPLSVRFPRDHSIDVESVRRRIQGVKNRQVAGAMLEERAPDQHTTTVTASFTVVPETLLFTAPGVSTIETALTTITETMILPPVTFYSGIFTSTITKPSPTKIRTTSTYITDFITKTVFATWTVTSTITPTASTSACKRHGGNFGGGHRW